jgi:hypothetical protein
MGDASLVPLSAVVIIDRADGNAEVGTMWQDTYVVPLDMTLREALLQICGPKIITMPRGRMTITVPKTIAPLSQDEGTK